METSKHFDRERRRTKPKTRKSWAQFLLNPRTFTFLVALGKLVIQVIGLFVALIKVMRE